MYVANVIKEPKNSEVCFTYVKPYLVKVTPRQGDIGHLLNF